MNDLLRDRLMNGKFEITERVSKEVDNTLEKINSEKSGIRKQYLAAAAILLVLATTTAGVLNPSIAKGILKIGSVFDIISPGNNDDYSKYSEGVGKTAISNGLEVSVNDAVCDDSSINIGVVLKKDCFDFKPPIVFSGAVFKVNGKEINTSMGMNGEFLDKQTYAGYIELDVKKLNLPSEFYLDIELNEIQDAYSKFDIKGSWDFKLMVSKKATDKETQKFYPEAVVHAESGDFNITEIVFSPINTVIYFKDLNYKKDENQLRTDLLNKTYRGADYYPHFYVLDDKGSQLDEKSSEIDNGLSYCLYSSTNYIPQSITIYPYKEAGEPEEVIGNIDEKYPIKLSQGKLGSIYINKIDFLENETDVYFKADGKFRLSQGDSIHLRDGNGKEINVKEFPTALDNSQESFKMVFDPVSKKDSASIATYNYDKVLTINEGSKVTIPLAKK